MSVYTTTVRFLCEHFAGLSESTGFNTVDSTIKKALPYIFNFDFPIFNESYKETIEEKIIKHYYTREICEETFGLWQLRLSQKLNDIMPYYNKLYESQLLNFDPLQTVNIIKEISTTKKDNEKTDTSNNSSGTESVNATEKTGRVESTTSKQDATTETNETSNITSNTNSNQYYSDTPQGGITGIESFTYLTNATKKDESYTGNGTNQSNATAENTETITKNDDFESTSNNTKTTTNETNGAKIKETIGEMGGLEKTTGNAGNKTYSQLLKEYRETFINIDLMIINELKDLFMTIY